MLRVLRRFGSKGVGMAWPGRQDEAKVVDSHTLGGWDGRKVDVDERQ